MRNRCDSFIFDVTATENIAPNMIATSSQEKRKKTKINEPAKQMIMYVTGAAIICIYMKTPITRQFSTYSSWLLILLSFLTLKIVLKFKCLFFNFD